MPTNEITERRKDVEASPYINHPISLANILCNETHVTDVKVICGTLLHDTIEDTETEPEELEDEFGIEIIWYRDKGYRDVRYR